MRKKGKIMTTKKVFSYLKDGENYLAYVLYETGIKKNKDWKYRLTKGGAILTTRKSSAHGEEPVCFLPLDVMSVIELHRLDLEKDIQLLEDGKLVYSAKIFSGLDTINLTYG